ncbi:MAG: GNAT family N-acetyltransferase [Fimbriimonadaceae bacterium]
MKAYRSSNEAKDSSEVSFTRVSREAFLPAYAHAWALEYPQDLRSEAEMSTVFYHLGPGAFEEGWVAEDSGAILVMDQENKRQPERLSVDLYVAPGREDLHQEAIMVIESIAARVGAKKVAIWTSDHPERLARLEAEGYECNQRVPVSRLSLSNFKLTTFEASINRVERESVRLATIAEIVADGIEWRRQLYDVTWEMAQDMPQTHPPTRMPYESFCEMLSNADRYPHDLMFVALDGERIVGYSRVVPAQAMPGLALTGISGVARTHRRRGIVMALKTLGIRALLDRGFKHLQTDNDETNPMYAINLVLGFRPVWSYLQFERQFK